MRTLFVITSAFVLLLGAANDAPWRFLLFLLPLLFTVWLVPGGFAWRRHCYSGRPIAPGPFGWPVFGSLAAATGPLAHRKLAALARSHRAGGLMSLSLGATPVVVSSHPETAREILHGAAFVDRPARVAARLLMFERAIGFAPGGGEHWRCLRRVAAASMFSPRSVAALAGVRRRAAEGMEGKVWGKMEREGEVAVRGVAQRAALESMVESVFGDEGEKEALMEMVKEGYELIGEFNLEDYLPLGGVLDFHGVGRRCRRLASRVREFVGRIVERRRSRHCCMHREEEEEEEEEEEDDFLSVLLSMPEEERLCDADIIAVLWEMVFRGTDAVAVLLEWILARMVLHPDIQSKVQEELDAVAGHRPVTDSDVPSLRYLQAVTKEVLRRHPPAPLLSWARLAVRDVHVGKHFVPAGTTAMVNMWAIAHDESLWPEPWAFRPDRFLDGEHRDVSPLGSDLRLAPFGSGRRVCPGRALGLATVHLWAARLLQRFRWTEARPVSLAERLRLSLEMKKPLACRVELRRGHDAV